MASKEESRKNNGAVIGFEPKLWLAADKLPNNMDAAEYKHVVLGLIFLKYISDAFEEMRAKLLSGASQYEGSDPEDADEYRAEGVFWVPKEARWSHLRASAKQPTIGKVVDDAMVAVERDNTRLKGVLPKDYARPGLDKHRLGELIDLIGTIGLGDATELFEKTGPNELFSISPTRSAKEARFQPTREEQTPIMRNNRQPVLGQGSPRPRQHQRFPVYQYNQLSRVG